MRGERPWMQHRLRRHDQKLTLHLAAFMCVRMEMNQLIGLEDIVEVREGFKAKLCPVRNKPVARSKKTPSLGCCGGTNSRRPADDTCCLGIHLRNHTVVDLECKSPTDAHELVAALRRLAK